MTLRGVADRARERLQSLRRRLLGARRLRQASVLGDLIVGNRTVKLGALLGHHRHPGISKAGRLSVAGYCDGRKVKVYSAFSPRQVALRASLQQVGLEGVRLPELIAYDDSLVIEAWVEGVNATRLQDSDRERVKQQVDAFLAGNRDRADLVHLAGQHANAFRYLEDYLVPRLGPWSHVGEIRHFLEAWQRRYAEIGPTLPVLLSHPDLSLANLIMEEATGDTVMVDNELLGASRGWILDRHNSCLEGAKSPQHHDLAAIAAFVEQTWTLRHLGSALDRGDMRAALVLIQ